MVVRAYWCDVVHRPGVVSSGMHVQAGDLPGGPLKLNTGFFTQRSPISRFAAEEGPGLAEVVYRSGTGSQDQTRGLEPALRGRPPTDDGIRLHSRPEVAAPKGDSGGALQMSTHTGVSVGLVRGHQAVHCMPHLAQVCLDEGQGHRRGHPQSPTSHGVLRPLAQVGQELVVEVEAGQGCGFQETQHEVQGEQDGDDDEASGHVDQHHQGAALGTTALGH